MAGSKEERKEGRKEERDSGRKEGRKEEKNVKGAHSITCYF